jgi:hypothetical protein
MKRKFILSRGISRRGIRIITTVLVTVFFTTCTSGLFRAYAEEAAVKTIPVQEIKKDESAGADSISLAQVEKARAITGERIYWLIGLWALIILAIILLRWQLRDDDKLYEEGYYSHDL